MMETKRELGRETLISLTETSVSSQSQKALLITHIVSPEFNAKSDLQLVAPGDIACFKCRCQAMW